MNGTGLVYSDQYLNHRTGNHPESPDRLTAILDFWNEQGILDRLVRVSPRRATPEEVALVHEPRYIREVEEFAAAGGGQFTIDTVLSAESYDVALLAAGGVLSAVDSVFMGIPRVFVLLRPPGHHAEPSAGMGFCLFNNVAIGARYARTRYGVERVLIVDWDLHHGNGTEAVFYDDRSVLFMSTHESPAYPGTGWYSDAGRGKGEGFTVNMPLPPGAGDDEIRQVFEEVFLPIARQFRPGLVMVSAGQDGHFADFMGYMRLTAAGYGWLMNAVREVAEEWASGRVVVVLEGGYNLKALPYSTLAVVSSLGGLDAILPEPFPAPQPGRDGSRQEFLNRLARLKNVQSRYWRLD